MAPCTLTVTASLPLGVTLTAALVSAPPSIVTVVDDSVPPLADRVTVMSNGELPSTLTVTSPGLRWASSAVNVNGEPRVAGQAHFLQITQARKCARQADCQNR